MLAARSNERVTETEALAPREQALGVTIRSAIREKFAPTLAARPADPSLREVLNTSMRGVVLTYAFDPRDPWLDPHLSTWEALACRDLEVPS